MGYNLRRNSTIASLMSHVLGLLLLASIFSMLAGAAAEFTDSLSTVDLHRRLNRGTVVTTSTCDKIRTEGFRAMLQLEFYYTAEFEGKGEHSLEGIENAVMRLVLDALHSCDDDGYPQFALDLDPTHQFSEEGFCIAKDSDNECYVIRGIITIFLDKGANGARDAAYSAIEQGLADPAFVLMFDPKVVTAKFFRSIQENLVLLRTTASISPEPGDTALIATPAKVAIAAASVAFIIASIFSYGILRRQSSQHAPTGASRPSDAVEYGRRRFFRSLDDDSSSDGSSSRGHIIDVAPAWNVSDITSDSGSIQSILTRSSGKLEKIVEEPEGHEDEEAQEDETEEQKERAAEMEKGHLRLEGSDLTAIANRNRLSDMIRSACFDAHFEDAIPNERLTPLTEPGSSFNDEEYFEEISWNDQPREEFSNLSKQPSDGDDDGIVDTAPKPPLSSKAASFHTTRQDLNYSGGEMSEITMEELGPQNTTAADNNPEGPLSDMRAGSETSIQRWLTAVLLQRDQKNSDTVEL